MSSPTVPWQQILGIAANTPTNSANTVNGLPSGATATPGLTTGLPIQSAINPNAVTPGQASQNISSATQGAEQIQDQLRKATAASNVRNGSTAQNASAAQQNAANSIPLPGDTTVDTSQNPSATIPGLVGQPNLRRGGMVERKAVGGAMNNPFGFGGGAPAPSQPAAPAPVQRPVTPPAAAPPAPMQRPAPAPNNSMFTSGGNQFNPAPAPPANSSGNPFNANMPQSPQQAMALNAAQQGNPNPVMQQLGPPAPSGGAGSGYNATGAGWSMPTATGMQGSAMPTVNTAAPRVPTAGTGTSLFGGPTMGSGIMAPDSPGTVRSGPTVTGGGSSSGIGGGMQGSAMPVRNAPTVAPPAPPAGSSGGQGTAPPMARPVSPSGNVGMPVGAPTGMQGSAFPTRSAGPPSSGMQGSAMPTVGNTGMQGSAFPTLSTPNTSSGSPIAPLSGGSASGAGTGNPMFRTPGSTPPQSANPQSPFGTVASPLAQHARGGMIGGLGGGMKIHPIAKIHVEAIHPIRMTNPLHTLSGGGSCMAEGGSMEEGRTDHIDPGTAEFETHAMGGSVEHMSDGAAHLRHIHHLLPKSAQGHIEKAHRAALDEMHNTAFGKGSGGVAASPTDPSPAPGPGMGTESSEESPAAPQETTSGAPEFKKGGEVSKAKERKADKKEEAKKERDHKSAGGAIRGKAGQEADAHAKEPKAAYARGGYVDPGTTEFSCGSPNGKGAEKEARGMGVAKRGGDFSYKHGGRVKK